MADDIVDVNISFNDEMQKAVLDNYTREVHHGQRINFITAPEVEAVVIIPMPERLFDFMTLRFLTISIPKNGNHLTPIIRSDVPGDSVFPYTVVVFPQNSDLYYDIADEPKASPPKILIRP